MHSASMQLIRTCLEDQEGNKKSTEKEQVALEMLQEERSEQSEGEVRKKKQKWNKKQIYPSLRELRKELEALGGEIQKQRRTSWRMRRKRVSS